MQVSRDGMVTVCIPTHNDSGVVGDALRSVLSQRYVPLEILVMDNGSTDETWRIVTDLADGDRRVRCERREKNIGMASNFNSCIAAASGEFVLILCADDALEADAVELLARTLKAHPDAAFAASARIQSGPALQPERVLRARPVIQKVGSANLLRECFVDGNRIGEPSGVMFRRATAARGFNPDYSQALDLEMWFHLLEMGPAVLLPQPGCRIRRHEAQTTEANIRSGRIIKDKQLLFSQYANRLNSSLTCREKLTWDVRMASSVARTVANGGLVEPIRIAEVFYPAIFVKVLCPLLGLAWKMRSALRVQRL